MTSSSSEDRYKAGSCVTCRADLIFRCAAVVSTSAKFSKLPSVIVLEFTNSLLSPRSLQLAYAKSSRAPWTRGSSSSQSKESAVSILCLLNKLKQVSVKGWQTKGGCH